MCLFHRSKTLFRFHWNINVFCFCFSKKLFEMFWNVYYGIRINKQNKNVFCIGKSKWINKILHCFWRVCALTDFDLKIWFFNINFGTIQKSNFTHYFCEFLILFVKAESHFIYFVWFLLAKNLTTFIWKTVIVEV